MQQAFADAHLLPPARALQCYRGPNPDAAAAAHQQYTSALRSHGPRWPAPGFASRPGPTVNFAGLGLTPPCTDARLAFTWLNDNAVRTALHARPYDTSDSLWQLCSDKILYTREIRSMIPIHRNLTGAGYGLLALVYSGDHDLAVPHTGSERWTRELGLPVRHEWAPWYDSANQVSGASFCCFVTEALSPGCLCASRSLSLRLAYALLWPLLSWLSTAHRACKRWRCHCPALSTLLVARLLP